MPAGWVGGGSGAPGEINRKPAAGSGVFTSHGVTVSSQPPYLGNCETLKVSLPQLSVRCSSVVGSGVSTFQTNADFCFLLTQPHLLDQMMPVLIHLFHCHSYDSVFKFYLVPHTWHSASLARECGIPP